MPSTLVMSRMSDFCTVSSAKAACSRIKMMHRRITPDSVSETHQLQHEAHQNVGWAYAIAQHSFTLQFQLHVSNIVGKHRIRGRDVARPHQSTDQHDLPLVVHKNFALCFDHQLPAGQNCDDLPCELRPQSRSGSS